MENNIEEQLRSVFRRVFEREFPDRNFTVKETEEWDSLSHVKLILELESAFNLEIDPEAIRLLYSEHLQERPILMDINISLVAEGKKNPNLDELFDYVP